MSKESIREISTTDTEALKRFVALERELVGSNPLFVSEIDADVVKRLSRQSKFFSEMEVALFVASNGNQDLARCTAKINHRYQQAKNEAVGFIGHFAAAAECRGLVLAMFDEAEAWLKKRGVTRVIAPYNGAAVLGAGLLSAAFDEEPMFPFLWHPPYYAEYFVACAYHPTYPFWYYTIDFASDQYRAFRERAAGNDAVTVRPVSKKHWNQDLESLGQLLNETFKEEWEFHPYTSEELHEFFDPLKPVLDTRQVLIGEIDGKPAGWCLGFPDWSPLFRSFKGKLGPLQIIKLLFQAGRYSRAGLVGIGVLPEHKGNGLAQALAVALYRRYEERGLKQAFYYPVNEDNTRSRRFAESMGGTGRVMYHCYDKRLS
ncbi:MAG: GNAT family N-acetyltransferase [Acidobacteriota bacterium]